jgi:hypothetical protein
MSRPDEIVARLLAAPLATTARIGCGRGATAGAPSKEGYYAWWCDPDAAPTHAPHTAHPSAPFVLLYVGLAPRDAASAARLRSRLCRQHLGGNAGSSTFRFGLASLLWSRQGWNPCLSGSGKPRLLRAENAALSAWQAAHLRACWTKEEKPWRHEGQVIRLMRPPMNRDHNELHPYYESMGKARDRFRAEAAANGPCPDDLLR